MSRTKIKGVRKCAWGNGISEVEMEYEIITKEDDRRVFQLYWGVTGYEGFYIDDENLKAMSEKGWRACMGTPKKYDELIIPASEMLKVYNSSEESVKNAKE